MPKNPETHRSAIQVIDRLGDLMNALMTNGGQASLKVLAAETGLHPSTAFRILSAAIANGWVARNDAGLYILGRHLIGLAQQSQVGIDVRLEALPLMRKLRQRLGETVNLTFREGDAVVYVERAISTRTSHVGQIIGSRAPLHVTAVGKLFLGSRGEQEIRTYAARRGLQEFTPNTVKTTTELIELSLGAWRDGYALDNEEAELGIGCIGVPVRNAGGEMIAGLSISAPAKRRKLEWIPEVLACGHALSERLGYLPSK
jgi:IclR family acetate operon transcriptional repressor